MVADLAGRQMRPLQARALPATQEDAFENLAAILRFRGTNEAHRLATAFSAVDAKGKDPVSLTWDKLLARSEKISSMLRDTKKTGLQVGSRVALLYRKVEVLEFIVSLFGCFLAGMVAVPINSVDDLSEMGFILNVTNTNLVLTTDYNHSLLFKDLQAHNIDLPTGLDWWRTNNFGTWYPPKKTKEYPPIKLPELAYIEYAKAINGELKGVAITHRTLMSEGKLYKSSTINNQVTINDADNSLQITPKQQHYFDTIVSYLEPRQQIGLIVTVLCSVFCGNHTVFTPGAIVNSPPAWIYVISKFKASVVLADYPAMTKITHYYQQNTKEVQNHSKKVAPDLSSLRYLFIDSCVVKPDVNRLIADKLLSPLGNTDDPMAVVCPVASLPEYGGMLLSFRDNLGPAQLDDYDDHGHRSVFAEGTSSDYWNCALDADALKSNKVVVVAAGEAANRMQSESRTLLVGSFGFPIAEGTVAIVDPDTTTLCPADTIGEVWIDAPSISGGFWALPRHSEAVFHAKPIVVNSETLHPEVYGQEFLRTGLVGTLIGGRLVLFGNYEDRIRQQRFGDSNGVEDVFFSNDILNVIETRIGNDRCTVFDLTINDQHLPVVMCESSAQRTELIKLTSEIEECVSELLGLRLFAIAVVPKDGLPRQLKHGREQIHMLMAKRAFLMGQVPLRYVRMDVDRTVFNLAANDNPDISLWRSGMAYDRAIRMRAVVPHHQQQHTGMETIRAVVDERTDFDLSKFNNIVDILQWRTVIHPEEPAFVSLSHNSSGIVETKPYTWRKINYSIAYVAMYLLKRGLKRGQTALVVVSFGIDWILAIFACLAIGVVPVPVAMPDSEQQQVQRIKDEVEAIYTTARDLSVHHVLVNNISDATFKHKYVHQAIRQLVTTSYKGYKLPEFTNVNRASKHHKLLGKESGILLSPDWATADQTHMIVSTLDSDGRRTYTAVRHNTIVQQCRVQKATSQMKWQRGIVATGLGAHESLGLLYSTFCGIYVGCITVLIPTDDYYLDPFCYFEMVQRYKAKDICVTLPMMQYAMNRMNSSADQQRRLNLQGVQNVMLITEGRPRPLFYQHLARFFAVHRLEKEALNTAYSHIANPMITTRSYMLSEPIMLIADMYWLRRGIIRALPLEEESNGVVLNDSGIVPSNTMIAIVNPETHTLCPSNMVGEIWVSSDCNVRGLLRNGTSDSQMLEASLPGADPRIKYLRTGDLGFLWNVHRRGNMMEYVMEEGQCLYVLGPKSDVLERNGLMHFPVDVEATIERCHSSIPANGSIVIQVNGEIIAIVAVKAKDQAVAVTPLIVSAVLENHAFLIDTVAIVLQANLPRSRFGEKQRDKALRSYLDKKL
ncbi:acetyl-CoA synthetase-like protein [Hesseltinella vesiculosa]|uniref:Acetyl-CoA synthetase-like protein n=1 Tax=Hesseltinella vesiculosa TaxID=101127 RepID=A0A1X2GKE6_9FUNG|nr:acetyl-CoA synthetase-like protein [Hesseltinella vesiculosa]